MDKKANDTFAFDLENRLDDFFSDSMPAREEPTADEPPADRSTPPLKGLKSSILAIDWEITDDALESFICHVDELMEPLEGDKVGCTLLKLLKSLGKYIRVHKSKAHPDTIKRIMAVYSALEESVTNDELSREEKEKLLLEEVRQFKRMKAQILGTGAPHPAGGSQKSIPSEEMSGMGAVIRAIDDLKSMMAAELGAIREELEQLGKK